MADQTPRTPPIIDGHNDTLLQLFLPERGGGRSDLEEADSGHIDLPRARRGGMAGGLFAMFTPSSGPRSDLILKPDGYEVVLADRVAQPEALGATEGMLSLLNALVESSNGEFVIATTVAQIEESMARGSLFAIPHIEGAEAIEPDLANLPDLYGRGIRSLGPVWSRSNAFGHGVPYAFPRSPDTGPGLTGAGRELVKACNSMGILIDLSHLNLAGFREVVMLSDAPLVATHSCVHRLCPVTRNLTDWQIDAIGRSGGVIGVAFDVSMVRSDGGLDTNTPVSVIARHVQYIADRVGIDYVALGSDFDGAVMPDQVRDVSMLPNVIDALAERGFDDDAVAQVTHRNWIRVLRQTWGESEAA